MLFYRTFGHGTARVSHKKDDLVHLIASMSPDHLTQHMTAHHQSGKSLLVVPRGGQLVGDFYNEKYWTCCFPYLFPYGVGGGDHPKRRRRITSRQWARHLINLADSRFQDTSFIMAVHNMLLRADAVLKVGLRVKFRRGVEVGHKEVEHALRGLRSENVFAWLKERQANSLPGQVPDIPYAHADGHGNGDDIGRRMGTIFNTVRAVGRNIPGTILARGQRRQEIKSMMLALGVPSLFITINPSEIHSRIMLYYAGKINESCLDGNEELPVDYQSLRERARVAAKNPYAVAKFFKTIIDAFITALLGWSRPKIDKLKESKNVAMDNDHEEDVSHMHDDGDRKVKHNLGLFGTVKGYYISRITRSWYRTFTFIGMVNRCTNTSIISR